MTTDTVHVEGAASATAVLTSAWEDTSVRVCIVYDCLYPHTIGGAERWCRNLAEHLAASGHEVTYVTLRQWDRADEPLVPGVEVVPAGPRMALYGGSGRRRLLPPIVFGLGVLRHLLRHGGRYDVVHTASFPYFSLLGAAIARRRSGYRLVVDWHEVWTRGYWRDYLGPVAGTIGWWVQRTCLRVPQRAFCFSRLHERRLHELGVRGEVTRLEGQYRSPHVASQPQPARPVVVYAGRHIPEKRALTLVPALVQARERLPELRAEIFGDGPERNELLAEIEEQHLGGIVSAPGFVDADILEDALSSALCLALPSSREGYGLVVVEAAARGVPTIVVAGPDNAATELVEESVNGAIAPSAAPEDLAAAIARIHEAGPALRASTLDWFRRNSERLSLDHSLEIAAAAYAGH
jgi:glycosyltransferase involved in cell wall biosynthesis